MATAADAFNSRHVKPSCTKNNGLNCWNDSRRFGGIHDHEEKVITWVGFARFSSHRRLFTYCSTLFVVCRTIEIIFHVVNKNNLNRFQILRFTERFLRLLSSHFHSCGEKVQFHTKNKSTTGKNESDICGRVKYDLQLDNN